MKNPKLVEILNTAADWIQDGTIKFNWSNRNNCTIGVIAKVANDIDPYAHIPILFCAGTWFGHVCYCKNINRPVEEIVQTLLNLGLSLDDIFRLEFCGTKDNINNIGVEIINDLDSDTLSYTKKETVVNFLRKEAAKIKRSCR
jgi:hypothetical protein